MPHEERNDGLKRRNRIALQRYNFAIECLKGEDTILDLGCGMGYGCHLLREAGHKVVGMDYSKEAIEYAQENYPGEYHIQNFDKGAFLYKNIVCLETLCHLKDPQDFISRLHAKHLVISAPIDPNPNDGYKYRLHNLSEEEFKGMFKDWEIVKELRQDKYLVIYLIKKI